MSPIYWLEVDLARARLLYPDQPSGRMAERMTSIGASIPVHCSKEAAPWRTNTSSPSTTVEQPA
jgi:hypothetical protein